MRKYMLHIGIFAAVLTVLLVYFLNIHRQWTANEMMSRAQIARMLALMRYDRSECEEIEKADTEEGLPGDISASEWYDAYAAVVLKEGWMKVKDDGGFHPADTFTYGDLRYIMEQFHLSGDLLSFSIKYRQDDGMVPKKQWCEVYQLLSAESPKIRRETLSVHGTPSNISGLGAWQVLTTQGVKQAEGLAADMYMDKFIEVFMAGDEILCMIDEKDETCRLENVWIESGEGNEIRVFWGGFERRIKLDGKLNETLEPNMGDLTFTDGRLTGVEYKTSRIKDTLTGIGTDTLILENYGEVPVTENLMVYQILPTPQSISKEMLAADGTVYEFVLQGNEICGVIYQDYAEETLRVLLHGNGDAYEQASATVTSDEAFLVTQGDNVHRYEGGSEVTLSAGGGNAVVKTESERGKIQVLSLERSCGVPSYHGSICLEDNGDSLLLINEVNLEDYVAGVIPGEMPVSYGEEALKVQAVCARTFAMRALGTTFRDYPANLDDTVSSQVYNNQEECEESIQAASETRGQVLQNPEGLTATYFFSTSCGHTSDAKDVWYSGGGTDDEEAVSVFLSDDLVGLNLMQEEDFRRFINMEDGAAYFEQDLPWFRWQTFISSKDIRSSVLNICQTDIGELRSIAVLERAESGLLKAIQLDGSLDTCTVYGEYKIRQVFSPVNAELVPQSGETVTGWTLLPSAYCYMDAVIENDVCEGYLIHGGGYGHGCGMSQNGAMKMAEMGKSYAEILKYFFPDSELVSE